jgi:PadR family transcriptional regulator PadR
MEGEILKGHLDMIVLAALAAGPAHGYAVIEEIRRRSGQAFDLPEGTVYPALHRLEQAGLLSDAIGGLLEGTRPWKKPA